MRGLWLAACRLWFLEVWSSSSNRTILNGKPSIWMSERVYSVLILYVSFQCYTLSIVLSNSAFRLPALYFPCLTQWLSCAITAWFSTISLHISTHLNAFRVPFFACLTAQLLFVENTMFLVFSDFSEAWGISSGCSCAFIWIPGLLFPSMII